MANKKRKISRTMLILVLGLSAMAIVSAIFFASPSKIDYIVVSDDSSGNYYTSVTKKNGEYFDNTELEKLTKIKFDSSNSGACNLYKDYNERISVSVTPYPEQYSGEVVNGKNMSKGNILKKTDADNKFVISSLKSGLGKKEIQLACRGFKEILTVNVLPSVKTIKASNDSTYVREGKKYRIHFFIKMAKGKKINKLNRKNFSCKIIKGKNHIKLSNLPSVNKRGQGRLNISAVSPGTAEMELKIGGCTKKINIIVEAKPLPEPKKIQNQSDNSEYNNNNSNYNYNYNNNNNNNNNNGGNKNKSNNSSKNKKENLGSSYHGE